MKFNFSIGHSERSEESRSWAAAGRLRLLAALRVTNQSPERSSVKMAIYSALADSARSYTERMMIGVFSFLLSTVRVSASCLPSPVIS